MAGGARPLAAARGTERREALLRLSGTPSPRLLREPLLLRAKGCASPQELLPELLKPGSSVIPNGMGAWVHIHGFGRVPASSAGEGVLEQME